MDKKTLLAFLLIAVVLIFTPYYMEMVSPTPGPAEPDPEPPKSSTTSVDPVPSPAHSPVIDDMIVGLDNYEKTILIKTDLYEAVISSVGGGSIKSFVFNNYFSSDSSRIDIINGHNRENSLIQFKNLDGDIVDLSGAWQYAGTFHGGEIYEAQSLVFSIEISPGRKILKTLTLSPGSYLIDVAIDMSGVRDLIFAGTYSLNWIGGLTTTEKNKTDDYVYFKSYVYQGGELEDLKLKKDESETVSFNGATDWVAIRTKYFITAFIPSNSNIVSSASIGGDFHERESYNMALSLSASDIANVSIYLGPLEYDRIKSIGKDLDHVMNFGIFFVRPISKTVLWVLKKLHNYIPNYGYILIIFAFAVKILVYPLTKKSYQSTAAMQQVQPEIMELKEKHKDNPKKLNQATMELYKQKGVNPLGGCLPMLLQMPLLFALFVVFRTTIELRAEPFVWWIKDLSAPDAVFTLPFSIPIYGAHVAILPILMVVSMFIQQRMMTGGAAQQPQQKTMQYFMTGFFFLMFNSFPSGLNLYYTLFNVLTIAQQKLIPPTEPIPT
jgi:YidC/Oxa1 family membrane protein insertase